MAEQGPSEHERLMAALPQVGFATMAQVCEALGAGRSRLKLTTKSDNTAIKKAIAGHLGDDLVLRPGYGGKIYLARRVPEEEIILAVLTHSAKPPSIDQLSTKLPIPKKDLLAPINALLAQGRITVSLNMAFKPCFAPAASPSRPPSPAQPTPTDRASFKESYNIVGHGRPYVRIHRIREHLGWGRERFDALLAALLADGSCEAHAGNPAALTRREVEDSFVDRAGHLLITLTWRGGKP